MLKKIVLFSLVTGFALSCKKPVAVDDPDEYDRASLLTNLADNIIVPAYQELQTKVNDLQSKVAAFVATTNQANLTDLRGSWNETLLAWQTVSLMEVGPGANTGQRVQLNIYPIDTALINSNITNGGYNLEAAGNLTAKGFQAMDFLIHGYQKNDTEILELYTSDAHTTSRKTYLSDLSSNLKMHIDNITSEWVTTYRNTFVSNSADNSVGSSIGQFVNAYVMHYEAHVRKGKVGLPAGKFNGFSQLPMPNHVEAFYKDESLPYLIQALRGAKKIFEGQTLDGSTNGVGLDDYLNFVNAKLNGGKLSEVISNQFDVTIAKAQTLSDPFSQEVQNNQTGVFELYDELQKIVAYLKTDMASELGVQITYVDNDGD